MKHNYAFNNIATMHKSSCDRLIILSATTPILLQGL
jgi:hypothetical protein